MRRPEDVKCALDLGVNAVGFVREQSSPRFIDDQALSDLIALQPVGPFVTTVSVFGVWRGGVATFGTVIQASEFEAEAFGAIWALRDTGDADLPDWPTAPSAILLDAHVEGQWGGTGRTVDWEWAFSIVSEAWPVPVILAGGLTPDNVAEAIRIVRPYAVDVSSGIEESPGVKDHGKMKAFVEAVRAADEGR
ncbi:MAG: phosphoribosylanthranilate isomerase [Armatimonadetes bacterium]|nr:phosphoribosylanthranilate isomerase [Armatimonadota bacterium]